MAKSHKTPHRRGSFSRINYKQRVIIENRYCIDKKAVGEIAREVGIHPSSATREIAGRPRVGRGKYSADIAQWAVLDARGRQGRKKQTVHAPLLAYVVEKLKLGWSPEQIALRLPIDYPKNERMRTSYEAIYQYVYAQIHRGGNGTVKKGCMDLRSYLARRHKKRAKKGFRKAQKAEREELPSIEDRPKDVEKRKHVGHWEDDTVVSRGSKVRVKSINERVSGVVFFGKTTNGTATECDRVVKGRLSAVPAQYRKTLTRDRGTKNVGYLSLEQSLSVSCYFAHPYCSHERGSNENTNGLLRRYFPKGVDFGKITDRQIAEVECLINSRPRKRLGGLTPYEVFYQKTGVALDS